ncbi:hypothetical protein D4764_0192090 [Takifugu flavidus]|uniref:Reverse transcriptase domain-containing protein n=1 Tax=Takifugu flavidus TaxID=433684 RepID=A0A5C6MIB7_9TELE|nr:hypothetical protein D4764_0192090 [Takifugu flavidus]
MFWKSGFIAMIRILYCDIASMLKFNALRLSLEPLLSRIRASVDGLFLPSFHRKIVLSAYTDDIIIMVRSQRDVDILSNLTVLFNRLSAARVNCHKSEALAVGREPTVHGARLDISAEAAPRLKAALHRTQTLSLQHVVAVAGPDLTGAEAADEGVLRLWRNRLRTKERHLLEDYGQGTEPDSEDPFPEIRLAAHLGNLDDPLLRPAKTFSLVTVDKKTLYNNCVRVLTGEDCRTGAPACGLIDWEGMEPAPAGGSPPVEYPTWGRCPERSPLQNEHCCVGPVPVLFRARDCVPRVQ